MATKDFVEDMDVTSHKDDMTMKLKKLSRINGEINRMTEAELDSLIKSLNLDTRGSKEVLKRRIKDYYKRQKMFAKSETPSISYDYLCIIDFEATCEEKNPENFLHEIIEFPAVLLCVHNCTVVNTFHRYCRPVIKPKLTDYCQTLTGITQSVVDSADVFPTVLDEFLHWLKELNLGSKYTFAIVTDGPWDMERFLSRQCEISKIPFPKFARKWINIRKIYCSFYKCKRSPLSKMLEQLGMTFEGRQHCGLDDAKNITRVVVQLIKDGASLRNNEWIHNRNTRSKVTKSNSTNKGNEISNEQSAGQHNVNDGDLGADPQVTYEDLSELVAFRTTKKR